MIDKLCIVLWTSLFHRMLQRLNQTCDSCNLCVRIIVPEKSQPQTVTVLYICIVIFVPRI
uniref:Uncharacterized protein n=1 Tax=Octopus bimaculoides TaxID=37653 RepID=A0A0L8FX33_OCTBM